jgi:hypothetical protein
VSVKITERDNGYKALLARFDAPQGSVTIGVHEAEGSAPTEDGEATLLDVAMFNEFGTASIPPRSFIGAWSDENEETNRERLRLIGEAVVAGKLPSIEVGLERFGLLCVADVQERIAAGIPPENAPSTIEKKGSSAPLIDTGQLRSSITHQVNK